MVISYPTLSIFGDHKDLNGKAVIIALIIIKEMHDENARLNAVIKKYVTTMAEMKAIISEMKHRLGYENPQPTIAQLDSNREKPGQKVLAHWHHTKKQQGAKRDMLGRHSCKPSRTEHHKSKCPRGNRTDRVWPSHIQDSNRPCFCTRD